MSDVFFFLTIFFFIFIAWVATGGPTRPISFAGPYITPITGVGVTQVGYGPQVGGFSGSGAAVQGTISSIQQSINDLHEQISSGDVVPNASPYHDEVSFTGDNNVGPSDPKEEYVSIRLNDNVSGPVDITGWRVESTASENSATIPKGVAIPNKGGSNTPSDILLKPGDTAILTTGIAPLGYSFKENECTGYLSDVSSDFHPQLSFQCPIAEDEYTKYYPGSQYRDGGCQQMLENLNQCQVPNDPPGLSSSCYTFMDARLSYPGCIATHQGDTGFDTHVWRIYFNRDVLSRADSSTQFYGDLWKPQRDQITLYDANGKTVDVYSY